MSIHIVGLGGYQPPHTLSNQDFEKMMDTTDEWIVTRTGMRTRHVCGPDENTTTMGVAAARIALENAGLAASDLTMIICHSVSPDTIVPPTSCAIMRELGARCPAFDINAACTGFLYALNIANAMATGPVLIVCSEHITNIVDYTDRRTCILFGDAAGAAVVAPGEGLHHIEVRAIPGQASDMSAHGINHKDETGALAASYMQMDGQSVFKFATREMMYLIKSSFEKTGFSLDDIAYIIPHQANLRIIQAAGERLNIPMEKFYINIEHTGNTSSASIPFALYELGRDGKIKRGDKLLLAGFGAGWTSGAAVIEYHGARAI